MERMIDMTEGEAEYLKYRFKQYLGSVSRAIQNKRLKEQKMGKSNLIPITKIYDIYPKYTYSNDVKKFMDEIVNIDRADVYTKDEVITILKELKLEINEVEIHRYNDQIDKAFNQGLHKGGQLIQQKIDKLKEKKK